MRLRPGILGLVVVLALAACGDGDDGEQEPVGEQTPPPAAGTDPPAEPTPDATPTPQPQAEPETYEVQQGDTLWDIAERFGVSVDAVVEANGIDDPSRIFPGDELVIPPGD